MKLSRSFDTSSIRHGFSMDIEQNRMSEIFNLYGFYFELVAERLDDCEIKIFEELVSARNLRFYIQVN